MNRRSFLSACAVTPLILTPSRAQGWDSHLAKLHAKVKCRAAMYGMDGTQWAGATEVKATAAEVKSILNGFLHPADMFQKAAMFEGTSYMATRSDGKLIILKHRTDGAVFATSQRAVTACVFSEADTTVANAVIAVENYVDYLKSLNYCVPVQREMES